MVWYTFVIPWYGITMSYLGMVWYHGMVSYNYVIPGYGMVWYGMTMGWLYTFTLGKPWAWCVAYTILSVAMFF